MEICKRLLQGEARYLGNVPEPPTSYELSLTQKFQRKKKIRLKVVPKVTGFSGCRKAGLYKLGVLKKTSPPKEKAMESCQILQRATSDPRGDFFGRLMVALAITEERILGLTPD